MASSDFGTGQVSVAATATQIVAQNRGRHAVVITNLGTVAIYLGNSSAVTTSTGQLLPGVLGASISIPTAGPVWGISSGSAQSVSFLDV